MAGIVTVVQVAALATTGVLASLCLVSLRPNPFDSSGQRVSSPSAIKGSTRLRGQTRSRILLGPPPAWEKIVPRAPKPKTDVILAAPLR